MLIFSHFLLFCFIFLIRYCLFLQISLNHSFWHSHITMKLFNDHYFVWIMCWLIQSKQQNWLLTLAQLQFVSEICWPIRVQHVILWLCWNISNDPPSKHLLDISDVDQKLSNVDWDVFHQWFLILNLFPLLFKFVTFTLHVCPCFCNPVSLMILVLLLF
jgi:hypothetical protein